MSNLYIAQEIVEAVGFDDPYDNNFESVTHQIKQILDRHDDSRADAIRDAVRIAMESQK